MREGSAASLEIRSVSPNESKTIDRIVDIHMATFQGFFLTFLGKSFLRLMYRSYCEFDESGILVAVGADEVPIGFLAYSGRLNGLYKYMIKKRLIPFAWCSFCAFLRKPAVFMRLVRAFLKPGEAAREERYIELASIGVDPQHKNEGIGSRLIDALKARTDFTKYAYITLETDAENNETANRFYRKNGFELVRTYATHEGRKMNEFRYSKA